MLQPLPNKGAPIPALPQDQEVSEALLIRRWIFGERKNAAFGWHIRANLAACVTGLILMAFWVPSVVAYDKYGDGCDTCHGVFDSGNYTSNKDATSWGTDLMDGHLSFISGGGSCDVCHSGNDRKSVRTNFSDDLEKPQGCVGCHGRVGDESGICAFGTPDNDGEHCGSAAGLRNVHNTAGIADCFVCHTNDNGAVLVGEHELPFNYGLTGIALSSPCVAENKFGPTGLDNDGDGAVDAADTDCSLTVDSDGDGVPDNEDAFPDDPTEWEDTDGDGIGNNTDPDDDSDGVPDIDDAFPLNAAESADTDGDGIGDNADPDDDGDTMPDDYEVANGLDPLDAADATTDADGDGFTNLEEFQAGTNPQNAADFPVVRKVPVAIFILLGED